MLNPIYTYRSINELRKIQEEREVLPFVFGETKEIIDQDPNVCVDLTALAFFVESNRGNIQPVYINFENMDTSTTVIASIEAANIALGLFPFLFNEIQPYWRDEETDYAQDAKIECPVFHRKTLYRYGRASDLEQLIQYTAGKQIPFATFSQANGDIKMQFEQFNKFEELAIVDLTSITYAIEGNKSLIYIIEQYFELFPNVSFAVMSSQVDSVMTYFPLFFNEQEHITQLLPDLQVPSDKEDEKPVVAKITLLGTEEFNEFWESFDHNLIGHRYFKKRFKDTMKHFMSLNRVKEQKVLSIFLYGSSGVGKTEVARLVATCLSKDCYLPKINFQNYSSQDSLNSLIGSPAGYVGCEHGELSDKIQKSNVGVLLCDEFEKTNRPVFSFFLELLEEGKFTDSMAREYDMDGYVIIFTSNIQSETDYKKVVPPELQTRFDLVCEFEQPNAEDKRAFLHLLLERARTKYQEQLADYHISEDDLTSMIEFDCSELVSLRDIKRVFNNKIMELFDSKEANDHVVIEGL